MYLQTQLTNRPDAVKKFLSIFNCSLFVTKKCFSDRISEDKCWSLTWHLSLTEQVQSVSVGLSGPHWTVLEWLVKESCSNYNQKQVLMIELLCPGKFILLSRAVRPCVTVSWLSSGHHCSELTGTPPSHLSPPSLCNISGDNGIASLGLRVILANN